MLKINYTFKNQALLDLALTQSGVDATHNNERLEFVGDRVLGLAVAELLYEKFPDETEGDLARRHAVLVSTDTLAYVAHQIDLKSCLHHGHMTGGRVRHVMANGVEALFGAIYMESGFDAARDVIHNLWRDLVTKDLTPPKDPKTKLQEFVQKYAKGELPVYEYTGTTGAPHAPEFHATVRALGRSANGVGTSKKAASTKAAEALLKDLAFMQENM